MQANPAGLGSGYVEVPIPGSHRDPASAAALAGGSIENARSETPGGEEPAPTPDRDCFRAEQGRRSECSRRSGSWNTRGGSIWNTRRICPTSWPMKRRSGTEARTKSPALAPFRYRRIGDHFPGSRAVRQQIRRNGKPWDQPFDALPGFKWYEGFGTEISPLFDPQCPTTIEYQGRSKVGGRQLLEYRFSSPVDGCFPFFYFDYQRYNPARTGHVFIDDPGGNVIQVDDEASGFPADFEFAEREEHVFWDYVKIGENSHLLPVRANFLVRLFLGHPVPDRSRVQEPPALRGVDERHVPLRSAAGSCLLLGNKLLDHEYKMLLRWRSGRHRRREVDLFCVFHGGLDCSGRTAVTSAPRRVVPWESPCQIHKPAGASWPR